MCVVSSPLTRGPADTNMAAVQVAVATAANHFAAPDDGSQEIYFTCRPHKMGSQIEISPCSWAETLPLFSIIEVRKRSKWDSSTRAVQEQVAVLGPMPPPPLPPVRQWTVRAGLIAVTLCIWALWGIYIHILPSPPPPIALPPPVDPWAIDHLLLYGILIYISFLWVFKTT